MSATLPLGAECYNRTATFTEESVPPALLREHSTKPGTWGLIRVEKGRLRYLVTDPTRPPFDTILTPEGPPAVIEPTILHRIEPLGAVRFFVEFLRASKSV